MSNTVPYYLEDPQAFNELAKDIRKELKRAGRKIRWLMRGDKVKIFTYGTFSKLPPEEVRDENDLIIPSFDKVKLVQIPCSKYLVDSRGRLVSKSTLPHAEFALFDLVNVQSKIQLELILNGLRQI